MKNNIIADIAKLLNKVRLEKPLVHHITNYVTANDCANMTLAVGASPIMAEDIEEVNTITSISQALVLNIGTLNKCTVASMLAAGEKANEMNIPVVLDPVGVGASEFRNQTISTLLERIKFSVIRGNMSEILYLAGLSANTKGVDASESDLKTGLDRAVEIAELLARKYECAVAITGATDITSNGTRTLRIENGHKMLSGVTGTGCMCTSLIGAFCGVTSDYSLAVASGVMSMGIIGEMAFEKAGQRGLGSYHAAIIDETSNLSEETIIGRANIHEVKR